MSDRDVAVVTGAGAGIGRATAIALARRGLDVALLGRTVPALEQTRAEVSALGAHAEVLRCDVAVEGDVDDAARVVNARWGAASVVVNNAGIVRRGARVEDTRVSDWDEVIAVNLRGPFLISRAFVPAMRARARGRLVHVASISSTIGCPENASYAASKWGLLGLVKSLAEELRGSGLVSVALLPGSVDTEMLKGSGFDPAMSADEVAAMIVHLALDAPPAIHASAIEMFG